MKPFVHFDSADIQAKVPMAVAIGLMKEAFLQLSEKQAIIPIRIAIESEQKKGTALFMPSYSPLWQLFGLKMVSVFPENSMGMPVIQGKMLVMSSLDGLPLALLDSAAVTTIRTGAASGLATDLLANQDAATLAIFGTGTQAWSQAEGVLSVRKIAQIVVRGTSKEKESSFCRMVSKKFQVECRPINDPDDLKRADIICTATTSTDPLFTLDMIQPGVHINGIGSFKPTMREIGSDVIKGCRLIVDQREAVLAEAGDVMIPLSEGAITLNAIHAELGEIIAQTKEGRTSSNQITVFKSVGNAIQDLAIANFLVNS